MKILLCRAIRISSRVESNRVEWHDNCIGGKNKKEIEIDPLTHSFTRMVCNSGGGGDDDDERVDTRNQNQNPS